MCGGLSVCGLVNFGIIWAQSVSGRALVSVKTRFFGLLGLPGVTSLASKGQPPAVFSAGYVFML